MSGKGYVIAGDGTVEVSAADADALFRFGMNQPGWERVGTDVSCG
jgi:hypothetical protein